MRNKNTFRLPDGPYHWHSCRGGGIGQALVAELVQRADDAEIFLTTLGSTERFYTPHGFKKLRLREIPRRVWHRIQHCILISRLP